MLNDTSERKFLTIICGSGQNANSTFSILKIEGCMTDATVVFSIAAMLRGYSIEVNPSQPKVVDAALERLQPGTEVFLTWIPGSNLMDTVGPAARLQRAGLVPVPHVAARHIENLAQLEQFAARLAGEAAVDRILIIGGDRATPASPYDSSLQIMQTGVLQKAGIVRMAVGGFPEGNPHISGAVLDEALSAKVSFAHSAGVQLSIVTQFCFAADPIVAWLRHIRGQGIDVPVRVGLAGPAGIVTLARYAVRCGIGNSLHVLTENPSFARLLLENGPEPIIRDIAASAGPESEFSERPRPLPLGIAGLHFYVFGGFSKTVDWLERVANSRSAHT
jgi:methylenetetrahydrofolate reductase (NADPH)